MAPTNDSLEAQADRALANGNRQQALVLLEKAALTNEASQGLWAKLSAMRKIAGDNAGALTAIEQALALSPLDFSALLARAMLLEKLGRAESGEAFGHALAQMPDDAELPASLRAAVAHARSRSADHQAEIYKRLTATLNAQLGGEERGRVDRFVTNVSRTTRHFHQQPTHFHFPGMPETEFYDRSIFPWLARLEAASSIIRDEFDALIAAEAADIVPYIQYAEHLPMRQWKALNRNRQWSAIHLLQNGSRVDQNAIHCPRTLAVLADLDQPSIAGASPNAMFSLLAPKTRIPAHVGVANTRLVVHLPLIVPPDCGFRVGATTRAWNVGEAFVFDDTIEHEAWNDSDQLRVVFIFDIWAPSLTSAERDAIARIIPAVGTAAEKGL